MKKTSLSFLFLFGFLSFSNGQKILPTNLYPTNLEENMYYSGYDPASKTIKGLTFMVLSDGNNSKDKTPEFVVKIYLYQEGKDPIFIKTIEEPGIWHMGSKEYKNMDIDISEFEVPPGTYRMGVLVNADKSFEEKESDNAILFQNPLTIGKAGAKPVKKAPAKKAKEETEGESDAPTGEEKESD